MQNRRANQEFEKQMFIEGGYIKIQNPHKAMGIIQQLAREDAKKSAVKNLINKVNEIIEFINSKYKK